jgi:hypothetical protein
MDPDEIEDGGNSVAWSDSSEMWLNTVDVPGSAEASCDIDFAKLKLPLRFPRQLMGRLSRQSYTAWHDSQNHDTPPRPHTRWTALEIE